MQRYLRPLSVCVLCFGLLVGAVLTTCAQPAFANAEAVTIDVTADVLGDAAVVDSVSSALSTGAVKFQEALAYLIGLVAGVALAGWAWVSKKLFGQKGKIPLASENKAAIDNAVQVGIIKARNYLQDKVTGLPDWEVESKTVSAAANFVLTSAPTALTALNITATSLESMIRERLLDDETAAILKSGAQAVDA